MRIKIYKTENCPYCVLAKEFLRKNKIKFEEIDVGKDHKAAKEMIKISGQTGVPVIDINGKIIIGFDEDELKEALDIK